MATDTGKLKSKSASKSEAFVSQQLGRAERRIRLLDLASALLGFFAGTFAFGVVMIVLDRQCQLSPGLRQLSLLIYLVGSAFYLGWTVVRPLTRRINPYFAARRVEETLPGAKNSVINWVDLRDQNLAPVIRGAINNRAAKDLSRADIDAAISARRTGVVGAVMGALAFLLIVLFILWGPRQFRSLLSRLFAPFESATRVASRTELQVVRPEGGNATVPAGRSVTIAVHVDGRVPEPGKADTVRLHWRYDTKEKYLVRPLQPEESAREWSTVLSPDDLRTGFWYKVTGGDDETPEYQVTVRDNPAVQSFQATYHFRPYVGRPDAINHDRKIEALRGTEVTLTIGTNRVIKSAQVELETKAGKKTVMGDTIAADRQSFQVRFILEENGNYRLGFFSSDDESFTEGQDQQLIAQPDLAPEVALTRPGKDIHLPANGVLEVEGNASDDIGVAALVLQMKSIGGATLRGQVYRSDKGGLKLAGGGYPRSVDYKDFVDFTKVTTADGKPYTLQPNTELEYWLEARDACDFPRPNVSQSKHFRVLLDPPHQDKNQEKKARDQANQMKKEHDAKQDEQRKKEDQARAEEQAKQEKELQAARDKPKPDDNGNQPNNPDQKNPGQGGNGKDDKEKQTKDKADQINQEAAKQNKEQSAPSELDQPKDDKAESKDNKPGAESKPGAEKQGQGTEKGENKKDGPKEGKDQGGEKKDGGKDGGMNPSAGKDGGQPDGKPDKKGEGKGGDPKGGQGQASDAKDGGKEDKGDKGQENNAASAKGSAPKDGAGKPGDAKDAGKPDKGNEPGDVKENGKDVAQGGKPGAGEPKGQPNPTESGEGKDGGKSGEKGQAAAKGEGTPGGEKQGVGRGPGTKEDGKKLAQGGGKGDPNQKGPSDADKNDLSRLARELQSEDPDLREKAARELDRVKEEAKDDRVKDLARRLKDALDKNTDNQPGGSKPSPFPDDPMRPPMGDGQEKAGEVKGTKEDAKGAAGKGKGGQGDMNQDRATPKDGTENDKTNDPLDPNDLAKGPGGPGKGIVKNQGAPKLAGRAMTGQENKDEPGSSPEEPIRRDRPDVLSQKAAEAQIEDFNKKLDKKLLERLKMTEDGKQAFLKNLAEMLKRQKSQASGNPEVVPPQQGVALPSTASQRPNSTTGAGANDTIDPNRGQAPPGYKEDLAEFLRLLNKATPKK